MGMGQNPIPLVNIKIAGKWMFIPLKMVLIGIDPYLYIYIHKWDNTLGNTIRDLVLIVDLFSRLTDQQPSEDWINCMIPGAFF